MLYIYGSGRCGSTLLDLLLNGHSKIIGLGEISTLRTIFDPFAAPDWVSAKFCDTYIAFWKKVKQCYEATSGESFEQIDLRHPRWTTIMLSWTRKDVEKWIRSRTVLLSCISKVSGAPILTDASKLHHQLYLLHKSDSFNIKVIHLVRDGRAVTASYVRRYNRFAGGLRLWMVTGLLSLWLRRKIGKRNWLQIKYEDIPTQPEEMLKRIGHFVNIDFEEQMLNYRSHPYFGIGGNPPVKEHDDEVIIFDERSKEELGGKYRLAFFLLAGCLNKLYGYGALW